MIHSMVTALALFWVGLSLAAPGADNTLLVVNADSPLSRTIANLYLEQRPLSRFHLVWLKDLPQTGSITMEAFKDKILEPVLEAMERSGIDQAIDTILYSADFPYRVYIKKAVHQAGLPYNQYVGIAASLSSLTWFANLVRAGRADFIAPLANAYYRQELTTPRRKIRPMTDQDRRKRRRARNLVQRRHYQKALVLLGPLLKTYPGYWELHLLQARALAGLGRFDAALKSLEELPKLGYRNSLALRNLAEFRSLHNNQSFQDCLKRMDDFPRRFEPALAFSHERHWSRTRFPDGNDFDRYYLSALLAYTGQRGNSFTEIKALLERSAHADGSHPDGTVYLMENENVRTETRQPWYAVTCRRLAELNRKCEILSRGHNGEDGVIPFRRYDIIGLVTGYRQLQWKRHHSTMLPGAIAEALTSYGGDFDNPSQSKLSVFLRHGASGSSGAVAEPYAIPQKFPLPLMHVYYAQGFSLGEAWYQAVASPYQTILVGDPLTRPFASPTAFHIKLPSEPWHGRVALEFLVEHPKRIDRYQIWIDGIPMGIAKADQPLHLDTNHFSDGAHEIIVTAVTKPLLEQRTSQRFWIRFDNHGLAPTLSAENRRVAWGNAFELGGRARPGATVSLRQGNRLLLVTQADAEGHWHASLPAAQLGLGSTELQIVTLLRGIEARSAPLIVKVDPPALEPPKQLDRPPGSTGLFLKILYDDLSAGESPVIKRIRHLDGRLGRYLESDKTVMQANISGYFKVDNPGFYQLTIAGCDLRRLTINDEQRVPKNGYLALGLKRGWYSLDAQIKPSCLSRFIMILGGETAPYALGGNRTRTGSTTRSGEHILSLPENQEHLGFPK